jgi:hypothetical protein
MEEGELDHPLAIERLTNQDEFREPRIRDDREVEVESGYRELLGATCS